MDERSRSCCCPELTDASALMSWEFPCPLPLSPGILLQAESSSVPGFQCPPAHSQEPRGVPPSRAGAGRGGAGPSSPGAALAANPAGMVGDAGLK